MYKLLESFSDGLGVWKFLPDRGHLLDQSETMMNDLLMWKYISGVIHKQNSKKDNDDGSD
jgi:hypothetical protein